MKKKKRKYKSPVTFRIDRNRNVWESARYVTHFWKIPNTELDTGFFIMMHKINVAQGR